MTRSFDFRRQQRRRRLNRRCSGGDEVEPLLPRGGEMGRTPCCDKIGMKKGKWTEEEDEKLINYIKENGDGSWRTLPNDAGLLRCGKSCRLRWINYLREDVKRGNYTEDEEETIVRLHKNLGNRWSLIASHLPGRTDNEIKNYWNSHLSRTIYRFRSTGNSSALSAADMTKMSSTTKKRVGRVSRAVAKKYNKNKPATAKEVEAGSPADSVDTAGDKSSVIDPLGPCESNNNTKGMSCNGSELLVSEVCPDAFIQSTTEASKGELPGPWNEVDEEISMHVKRLLGNEVMDLHENTRMNDCGNDVLVMNTDGEAKRGESDCGGAWSSNSETIDHLYGCNSPIVSCFSQEEGLQWDQCNGTGEEGKLWIEEEEDIFFWS